MLKLHPKHDVEYGSCGVTGLEVEGAKNIKHLFGSHLRAIYNICAFINQIRENS